MAHTNRQPTDEVFKDIQSAAIDTWFNGHFHESYLKEKIDKIGSISNYADNWYSMIGAMDERNQMIFWQSLKLKDSEAFLRRMVVHYNYFTPREKL